MSYEIVFTDTALAHYRHLDTRWRTAVKEAIHAHLRHEPTKISKSRIKRLREIRQPEYRLRVDDYRVFYDVDTASNRVAVLAIVPKQDADKWLQEFAIRNQ